uniref:Uncharacterized protein n=1 Tax=Arundo donax TaxID=35708 RepID=A0A0A9GU79_ARUDO
MRPCRRQRRLSRGGTACGRPELARRRTRGSSRGTRAAAPSRPPRRRRIPAMAAAGWEEEC